MSFFRAKRRLSLKDRDPHLIVDKEGRVFVVLVGRPAGYGAEAEKSWDDATDEAFRLFAELRNDRETLTAFKGKDLDHCQGKFLAVALGVLFGGGQTVRTRSC